MFRILTLLYFPLILFSDSFLYQLKNFNLKETVNSNFKLVITSYSKNKFNTKDIQKLHNANKTVLAYINIGEIHNNEYYFNKSWIDTNGNPSSKAPQWLGNLNPKYPEIYKVRYWYDEWFENFIKPYIDKIINSGFDGVYLDKIDTYKYWANKNNDIYYGGVETLLPNDPIDDKMQSAQLMIKLVKKISNYAKSKKPNFLIYTQNGVDIINYDKNENYFNAIDGIGVENLFYNKDKAIKNTKRVILVKKFLKKGKNVLVTDYVDDGSGFKGENRKRILNFIIQCKDNGFTPYVADINKSLDRINPIAKGLAAHLDTIAHPFFRKFNIGIGSGQGIDFEAIDGSKVWMNVVDLMTPANLNVSPYTNIKNYNIKLFKKIQSRLINADFLTVWVVKGWQESWFDKAKLQKLLDHNKTIIFNYWYFGDNIGGNNAIDIILKNKDKYLEDASRLGKFISNLKGTVAVVIEPEFNKPSITTSSKNSKIFASILKEAMKRIKSEKSDVLLSICPMDTGKRSSLTNYGGYKRDSLGDKYEWSLFFPIIDELKDEVDFITFNTVVGQFSKDPSKFPSSELISYTKEQMGLKDLPKRIENFSSFLNEHYYLPVLLGYITFPETGWKDLNGNNLYDDGELIKDLWLDEVVALYHRLKRNVKSLYEHGLFGFAPVELFDDPDHDMTGYQFFSENEYHMGIIATNAKNGVLGAPRSGNIRLKGLNGISILDILYTDQPYLFLDKGWNLIGLPKKINLSQFNAVWGYKNLKWFANIKGFNINELKNYNIYKLDKIEPDRGYWVLTNKAMLIPYDKYKSNIKKCVISKGWNLCSHLETEDIEKENIKFIWKYDRGIWKQRRSNKILCDGIDYIENIYKDEGIWIKK